MKFSWKKNNLDEMQEQKLLHIEKNSFWFLYWALVIVILGQLLLGATPGDVAAELICFLATSIFMLFQCVRNGIWDRHFKPDWQTNLGMSIAAGVVVALLQVVSYWLEPERWQSLERFTVCMVFIGIFTFITTFSLMSVIAMATQRRKKALEDGEEEEIE